MKRYRRVREVLGVCFVVSRVESHSQALLRNSPQHIFSRRDISKWSGTKAVSQSLTYNHCMESVLAAENRS